MSPPVGPNVSRDATGPHYSPLSWTVPECEGTDIYVHYNHVLWCTNEDLRRNSRYLNLDLASNDRVTIAPDVNYLFLVSAILPVYCSRQFSFGYSTSRQNKQFWL
jgi:hypothetical protein